MGNYAEVFERHKGPYNLIVWRTTVGKNGAAALDKKVVEKTDDPFEDARMLLSDPRDCVTCVDVWSVSEQQFATTIRRQDIGVAPIPGVSSEPAAPPHRPRPPKNVIPFELEREKDSPKKTNKAKETPVATKKTPKATGGRSSTYVVAKRDYDPGKGEVATGMWKAFLAMKGPFTAKEVAARFKSLNADMVGPYASHFKKQGGLKAAEVK